METRIELMLLDELHAKAAHVDVHRALVTVEIVSPHALE
jgi:hypothetical protein